MRYQQASALFKEYLETFVDDRCIYDVEMQKTRREFMHAFTHANGTDRQEFINYAKECLMNQYPTEDAKSKVYDFEYINQCNAVIDHMEQF